MSTETKKAIVGLLVAAGLYYLIIHVIAKKKDKNEDDTPPSENDIQVALTAYKDALSSNPDPVFLKQLNDELLKQHGVTVRYDADTDRATVYNKDGKILRVVS